MPGKDKKYAVEGMRVKCSIGTTMCTLNTMGHGVTYQGKSVLNANDHIPMVNITTFGTCINKPCVPVTPLAWRFCNEEHMIDGAPALTTDSLCTCMLGGVISIVDNSVSMGGIDAQSAKPKSDVGNKSEIGIKEITPPNSMHHAHNGDEVSSDLKSSTELIDKDGKRGDNVIYEENSNTSFTGKLRGQDVTLTDVYVRDISYIKRSSSELNSLREDFNKTTRSAFLKDLGRNVENLKEAGFSKEDILRIQDGKVPTGWQVHHKLPLDDSGTNSFDNLVLIQNEPYHKVVTNYQNSVARQMTTGEVQIIQWPIFKSNIYPTKH